jgi:hypothetical protein
MSVVLLELEVQYPLSLLGLSAKVIPIIVPGLVQISPYKNKKAFILFNYLVHIRILKTPSAKIRQECRTMMRTYSCNGFDGEMAVVVF